jgi:hypothetical protein
MSTLTEILEKCLSPENLRRKEGEDQVNSIAKQNFGLLLIELSKILSDENVIPHVRTLSSTILKNLINNQHDFKGKWDCLSSDERAQIKNNSLASLASLDKEVRKAGAIATAGKFFLNSYQYRYM